MAEGSPPTKAPPCTPQQTSHQDSWQRTLGRAGGGRDRQEQTPRESPSKRTQGLPSIAWDCSAVEPGPLVQSRKWNPLLRVRKWAEDSGKSPGLPGALLPSASSP